LYDPISLAIALTNTPNQMNC